MLNRYVAAPLLLLLSPVILHAQTLTPPWASSDVGLVSVAGSATGDGSSFSVSGAGDVSGTADAFRFVYVALTGDGSIVSQVSSIQGVADWSKAGVMMRESLSPGAPHASVFVTAAAGVAVQRRIAAGGTTSSTVLAGAAPAFVRLRRTGNTIEAARSADAVTWKVLWRTTMSMVATIYVGIAVSSHDASAAASAMFASTSVTGATASAIPTAPVTETIVIMRHGEKPAGGYGQLTCQGFQRALALTPVLTSQFGTPTAVFAPNPAKRVVDPAGSFDYVRPLATIEPTAIRLGLPVDTDFGYSDLGGLQNAVLTLPYAAATLFVAWEHLAAHDFAQGLMNLYGGGSAVPAWAPDDYDSLYVVRLTNSGGVVTAVFQQMAEGLTGLPTACP